MTLGLQKGEDKSLWAGAARSNTMMRDYVTLGAGIAIGAISYAAYRPLFIAYFSISCCIPILLTHQHLYNHHLFFDNNVFHTVAGNVAKVTTTLRPPLLFQ